MKTTNLQACLNAIKALIALSVLTATPAAAFSDRVERCAELYVIRNNFFHNRGLCFTRPSANRIFTDNALTCTVESSKDVPISKRESDALKRIRAEEIALACPRP